MLFRDDRIVLNGDGLYWSVHDARGRLGGVPSWLAVAEIDGVPYLAAELEADAAKLESKSLRSLYSGERDSDLRLLSRARQLLHWRGSHRYCGTCGAATVLRDAQRCLECPVCARQFFPRINPCVIVLVTRGEEVLLARNARFRGGYYSCLAGFIEVGETPEQAVAREVREEVDVELRSIRYVESQSWPFPSQLMLGFWADYRRGEITPEPGEIEAAAWFHIDSLPPTPAAAVSVAGRLIDGYARSLRGGKGATGG